MICKISHSSHIPQKMKNKAVRNVMKIDNNYLHQAGHMPFREKIIDFLKEMKHKIHDDEMEDEILIEQLLTLFKNHLVKSAKEVAEIKT